jgi:hypothetical protein
MATLLTVMIIAIVVSLFAAALWLSRDYESRKIQANLQAQTEIESAALRSRLKETEASLELIAIDLKADKPEFSLDTAVQEVMRNASAGYAIIYIEQPTNNSCHAPTSRKPCSNAIGHRGRAHQLLSTLLCPNPSRSWRRNY